MSENENNLFVGDGNTLLYTGEYKISKKVIEIMTPYRQSLVLTSNKDFNKKSIELFHLLTHFEINKNLKNVKKIVPHEPGDFLVTINGNDVLYEVVTVFGDKEAKVINDLVKYLLNIKNTEPVTGYLQMDVNKLSSQFKRVLNEKKEKQYFSEFDHSVLLLVTSEHDRSGTTPWYLVDELESDVKEFINKTESSIECMNYFSSGKDGNPTTSNIKEEILLYKACFN